VSLLASDLPATWPQRGDEQGIRILQLFRPLVPWRNLKTLLRKGSTYEGWVTSMGNRNIWTANSFRCRQSAAAVRMPASRTAAG